LADTGATADFLSGQSGLSGQNDKHGELAHSNLFFAACEREPVDLCIALFARNFVVWCAGVLWCFARPRCRESVSSSSSSAVSAP
jgi:hypothetical protein